MVVELKKLKQEKIMAEYETQVSFYQRYNYGATAPMRKQLVDQMNKILDDLYENRYEELFHQNAFRQVKGKQLELPVDLLPKEMSDFILTMGTGYLQNSGLHFMDTDPAKINLEIETIWATDSEENDYNRCHSHFGLMSGVFYLKVPPQVSELNEEGALMFHHAEDGYVDVNPYSSIRPKGYDMSIPEEGKFVIFPAWQKHSVNPFFGPGIRRSVAYNIVCPDAADWKPTAIKEPYNKRKFEQSLKIDTTGGPDAKLKGDRDLSNISIKDASNA